MHFVVSKFQSIDIVYKKSEIKMNNITKKIKEQYTHSNILLIPCILIRHLYVLFLMINPYLQECLFESMKLSRRESRIFEMRIVGENIDEQ